MSEAQSTANGTLDFCADCRERFALSDRRLILGDRAYHERCGPMIDTPSLSERWSLVKSGHCVGLGREWLRKLAADTMEEVERLKLVTRSHKRKKCAAVTARNVHAEGLDYWRERAMEAAVEIARLQAEVAGLREKRAPVQGYEAGIPWSVHLRAYDVYCKRYGAQEAMIDLEGRNCRGGFGAGELDRFIPGWREEVSEITALKAEIARLRALPAPATAEGEVAKRCAMLEDALQTIAGGIGRDVAASAFAQNILAAIRSSPATGEG